MAMLPLSAPAQTVTPCADFPTAEMIAEPWEDFTRTFANGDIRVTLIDTVEPGAAAYWLMVLTPPRDELGFRSCHVIGLDGLGFADAMFPALAATYDPAQGLMFTMPVRVLDDSALGIEETLLAFSVNQATGTVKAELP